MPINFIPINYYGIGAPLENLSIVGLNKIIRKIVKSLNKLGQDITLMNSVPNKSIIMWSNSINTIPNGWVYCDGNNGTPNLVHLFVVGASDILPPGTTGGTIVHNHTIELETQKSEDIYPIQVQDGGTSVSEKSHTHKVKGSTASSLHIPPFYALVYIMKL